MTYEFQKQNDYSSAERAWRATLTRYIGWVFRHTLILLKGRTGLAVKLPIIDVNALEDIADGIARVLKKQGKSEGILHTFDHLANTVPLPGLNERMVYLKCLWLFRHFNDRKGAEHLLNKWPSFKSIQDIKLLQIYFELRADSFSLIQSMEVIQTIIERATTPVEKLHYTIAKTITMVLLGADNEALQLHTDSLNALLPTSAEQAKNGDFYSSSICAEALEMQGLLNKDKIYFDRALSFLQKVDPSELTAEGAADLLYAQGKLHWLKGDSTRAMECFTESYKVCPGVLALIYRLDTFVRLNEFEKAELDLNVLRNADIRKGYKLEFLRSATGLAVKTGNVEEAHRLVKELKSLELPILHFRVQRDELCFALLDFAEEQRKKKINIARRRSIWENIQKLFDFIELKPNIGGIGLNLNRIFEKKDKDSR